MPDFEKVIVHVLDCEQNTCIMSTACMQELQPEVEKMMQTKASKVFSSSSKKSGKFKESSQVKQWLDSYKLQEQSFEQLSCLHAIYSMRSCDVPYTIQAIC